MKALLVSAVGFSLLLMTSGCGLLVSSHHDVGAYTVVVEAADRCDVGTVHNAVEEDRGLVRAKSWDRATLLHEAVAHDCTELAAYLLDKGSDPNSRKSDGVTPLHLAAQHGKLAIIKLLLEHGAHINKLDTKSWTPLDRAVKWSHPEAVSYLREHGGRSGRPTGL
jgi:hypothetical protein